MFYLGVVLIGKLYTLGEETRNNEKGEPFPEFEKTPEVKLMLAFVAIGIYWMLIFLNNYLDYVACAVALNHFFKNLYA